MGIARIDADAPAPEPRELDADLEGGNKACAPSNPRGEEMVMPRRKLLTAALLLALAAAPTAARGQADPARPGTPPAWPDLDQGYMYLCTAVHRDPHGTLTLRVAVHGGDPSETDYYAEWTSVRSPGGLTLSYVLADQGTQVRVTDLTLITLIFEARWRGDPRAMILLSKSGRYNGVGLAFRGEFERAVGGRLGSSVPLGELRAYAGGAPLTVMVKNRRSEVLARDRIDPALLDAAVAAAEAVRPEAQAMAADYRNRCERREATIHIMI